MECNTACGVHDEMTDREKQSAFGAILESVSSLLALLIYFNLLLL